MTMKLTAPAGCDSKVTYEIRAARKEYRCDGYPASHATVIKVGELHLLCTEFPGGESGYADDAGKPVRLRLCMADAPLWVNEQFANLKPTDSRSEGEQA